MSAIDYGRVWPKWEHGYKTPLVINGGKTRNPGPEIVQLCRSAPHNIYHEPFGGGAAVWAMLGVPQGSTPETYRQAINDKDNRVMCFWRQYQCNFEKLNDLVQQTLHSRNLHRHALDVLDNASTSDLERAWAFWMLALQSHSRIIGNGWVFSRKGRNPAGTVISKHKSFGELRDRMRHVQLDSVDALTSLRNWDSPSTLHYLDPPYQGANQGHYSGWEKPDLIKLLNAVQNLKGSFILSDYPSKVLVEFYEDNGYKVNRYSRNRVGKTGTEVKAELVVYKINPHDHE